MSFFCMRGFLIESNLSAWIYIILLFLIKIFVVLNYIKNAITIDRKVAVCCVLMRVYVCLSIYFLLLLQRESVDLIVLLSSFVNIISNHDYMNWDCTCWWLLDIMCVLNFYFVLHGIIKDWVPIVRYGVCDWFYNIFLYIVLNGFETVSLLVDMMLSFHNNTILCCYHIHFISSCR